MNSITTRPAVKTTATEVKPRTKTEVTFDSTRHRNRHTPSFAAGLLETTRWTGQHAFSPFTVEEQEWASECFRHASVAEVDAEEAAYHEMLDALALESAMVDRICRGHVGM